MLLTGLFNTGYLHMNMSASNSYQTQSDTLGRTCSELRKLQSASMEANVTASQHGTATCEEEDLVTCLAQDVTQKISALMDLKFTKLHLTLEGINNRIEVNTKHITEAQSSISDTEDYATSLSNKTSALEKEVKTLSQQAEDSENCSRRENIRIIGLKEGTEGQQPVKLNFLNHRSPTFWVCKPNEGQLKSTEHTGLSAL